MERSVILLETSICRKRTPNELIELLFPLPLLLPLKKNLLKREAESPVGGQEGLVQESDVCKTEPGTEVDVEDKDVNVVGGFDEVGVSGLESEGFKLSETLR